MGQQRQVARDQNLLAQLAVEGQLGVETVPLQVEDENSKGGDDRDQQRVGTSTGPRINTIGQNDKSVCLYLVTP